MSISSAEALLALAAAGSLGLALSSAPKASLPTLALVCLAAYLAWRVTSSQPSLNTITQIVDRSQCSDDATCPVNRCAIQSLDNPFANPGIGEFGTSNLFADRCPLARAKALMQSRSKLDGVAGWDHAFYSVPSTDAADFRQWLYSTPENCKHNQAACRPNATVLDAARRDPYDGPGSFVDHI